MTGPRAYRHKLIAIGAVLPLTLALSGAAVILSWLPRLPDEVAVHWTSSGADGFATPLLYPGMLVLITALFTAIVVTALWNPGDGRRGTGRFLLATAGWLPTFLAIGFAGSLAPQLDTTDPAGSPFPGIALLVGAACGVLVGAGVWALAPVAPPFDRVAAQPEDLSVADGVRVIWLDTASAPRPLIAVLGISAAVLVVVGVGVTFSVGTPGLALLAAPVILAVACLTLSWRVRIDDSGLVARPAIGIPRVRIPLDHVKDASVVEVSPVNDFGGWGLRYSSYGTGVILRAGSALRLEQTGGAFTITLDDAPRAAGLVRALLARRRAAPERRE
ncbi:hypothetical protein [Herbiconiux sp. L3-i23]|uniref:hypothetical protein n=1 Tax=Herbiconiux sp. L3-i23 TaxID=2905871 RepID=UPI0020598E18|nr:hypothetical protein [Herbiconiux sp. L3-i23]BDI23170.1 hypothetical protein L3i23_19460 [Herbiconiux sp. L3-i23]